MSITALRVNIRAAHALSEEELGLLIEQLTRMKKSN